MTTLSASDLLQHTCSYYASEDEDEACPTQEIIKGAMEGCDRCALGEACIRWIRSQSLEVKLSERLLDESSDVREVLVKPDGTVDINGLAKLEILKMNHQTRRLTYFNKEGDALVLPRKTSSKASFDRIHAWRSHCLSDHADCKATESSDRGEVLRGTRFLQIAENDTVRLVEDQIPHQYACLSHCWGSGKGIPRTTKANIAMRRTEGLHLVDMPKTFQDAVRTCKNLRIFYLWIDSLCIIQDDGLDWTSQAARMAYVYEFCTITIAALKAKESSEGLFSKVERGLKGETLPDYTNVYIRKAVGSPLYAPPIIIKGSYPDNCPLLHRAWTFQELILAPRILYFGAHEVIWHCRSEDHRLSENRPGDRYVTDPNLSELLRNRDDINSHLQEAWYGYVKTYSKRDLTFKKDRLPAIAAIARKIFNLRLQNDEYLAGLWRSTLIFDLGWQVMYLPSPAEDTSADITGIVPTWSWASRRLIYYSYHPSDTILANVRVHNIFYEAIGPAVLGACKKGAIVIEAPLIRLKPLRFLHYLESQQHVEAVPVAVGRRRSAQLAISVCYWDDVRRARPIDASMFAIPLTVRKRYGKYQCALLISKTATEWTFERLGLVGLILIKGKRSRSQNLHDPECTAVDEDCNDTVSQGLDDSKEAEANTYKAFIEIMETKIITLV